MQERTMADPNTANDDDRQNTYDPSELEATLEREQGLGMGARDLQRQRDPGRPAESPSYGDGEPLQDPEDLEPGS
jgi:hypothetical protein